MMKTKSSGLPSAVAAAGAVTPLSETITPLPMLWTHLDANANNIITLTMRPNTLKVNRDRNLFESKKFIREALSAWQERANVNHVPADKLQELFQELKFYPSEEQVHEMLQTAKLFARRTGNFDTGTKQLNGLTFGEFCVLLADLKRFSFSIIKHDNQSNDNISIRSNNNFSNHNATHNRSSLYSSQNKLYKKSSISKRELSSSSSSTDDDQQSTLKVIQSLQSTSTSSPTVVTSSSLKSTEEILQQPTDAAVAPEVFLGGSCNPTTWRADVAIPALDDLGISFYNPQVSDWTPDLIELEHRAKEKARVLFFVMDSETRASAGAIEAAHIAGQNSRHLVLVLHPYRQQQSILNEPVSTQEYIDLSRNQQLLQELVTRRGLPVMDSIQSGLQRTKSILAGNHLRDPPSNIASRLISVRRAFDRVVEESKDTINLIQCQKALSCLGYPNNILSIDNLNKIIESYKECSNIYQELEEQTTPKEDVHDMIINFDDFCVITAYLSVLQQEINNSSCVSPIKGINVPPPPIFFTNAPEYIHSQPSPRCHEEMITSASLQRTNSRNSDGIKCMLEERQNNPSTTSMFDYKFNRDSGTSSPQPQNETAKSHLFHIDSLQHRNSQQQRGLQSQQSSSSVTSSTKISVNVEIIDDNGDDSDSTDSVFSSEDSEDLNVFDGFISGGHNNQNGCMKNYEIRDLYLGGSCILRTKWRQEFAIPYLKANGTSYYLPSLHESITNKSFLYNNNNSNKNGENVGSGSSTVLENHAPTITEEDDEGDDVVAEKKNSDSEQILPHSEKRLKSSINSSNSIINSITHQEHDTTVVVNDIINNLSNPINSSNNSSSSSNDETITSKKTNLSLIENSNLLTLNNYCANFPIFGKSLFNPMLLDSSRVLFFFITNETRSLAPMTLAAHYIGWGYNVVLCVQMLPEKCKIGNELLTPSAIKDYNRGRAYLIDLAKRQGIPVFNDPHKAIDCAIEKVKMCKSRHSMS